MNQTEDAMQVAAIVHPVSLARIVPQRNAPTAATITANATQIHALATATLVGLVMTAACVLALENSRIAATMACALTEPANAMRDMRAKIAPQ